MRRNRRQDGTATIQPQRRAGKRGWVGLAALLAVIAASLPLGTASATAQPTPSEPPSTAAQVSAPPPPEPGQPPADAVTTTPDLGDFAPPAPVAWSYRPGEELVDKRTASSKTFAGDKPGEFRTEAYPAPVHFRDRGGRWADIDSTLAAPKDGKRKAKANAFTLELAERADADAVAQVGIDAEHSVGFSLEGATKAKGTADARSVTYAKVRPGTDLRLTSQRTGVKEELVLASPAAPDRFVFPLKLRGLTASIDDAGDVVYRDKSGTERARTPHGFMTDARVDTASGEPALSTGVTYALVPRGKGVALEVRLDRAWLDDPARRYPITVDPYIATASWGDDTYVMSGFRRDASYDAELKVGTYDGGAHIGRSYVHFDTSLLAGATVTRAEMHAAERWSWNCGYWPEAAYRVTQGWNGRTMVDFPGAAVDPNWAGGVWAGPGCNNRTAIWDVTGFASYWAAAGETQGSISLRATNEADNNRWKKYNSAEAGGSALHVWYNHAPVTPVSVSPTNGQRVLSPSTPLSATYADADGTAGYVAFGIWNPAGQMIWSAWSPPVCASWCGTSVAGPWLPDGWYYIQTAGWDGQYVSAFSAPQWFFVDTRPPPPPTAIMPANGAYVGSPVTASALYTEPYGFAGNVLFWVLDPAGNVVTGAWSPTTAYGARATVTLPPLNVGTYHLYVLASDGALSGWAPPQTFTVGTAPVAPTRLQALSGAVSALLSWVAPPSTGGPISSYTFTATDTAGGTPIQASCTSCTTSFTMGGLTAGRSYNFTAKATNAIGTGPASAPVSGSGLILPVSALLPTQVAAGYYDDGQIRVTWQESAIHVPLITRYVVRAYLAPPPANGGAPPAGTPVAGSVEVASPATSAVVGGLTNGTAYYATVEALTLPNLVSSDQSPSSNTITAAGKPSAPAAPSVLAGDTTASVSWTAPDDHGNAITAYTVKLFNSANQQLAFTQDVVSGPATFSNLINGTAYYTTVSARNDVGTSPESAASTVFTPAGRPFRPTNVTAVAGSRQATVSWQAADGNGAPISGYTIIPSTLCPGCQGLTASGGATSTTVVGLHPGDAYFFTVVAANAVGDSDPSAPSDLVTPPPEAPSPPTNVRVMPGDGQLSVSWDQSDPNGSPVTLYTVTAEAVQPANGSGGTATSPGGGTATVTGLENGTTYSINVVATNSLGDSEPALGSGVPAGLPAAPSNVDATFGDGQATVSWSPPDSNGAPITRYTITVYSGSGPVGTLTVADGSATSAVVYGLDNTIDYFFDVAAGNAAGDGPGANSSPGSLKSVADGYMNGSLTDFLLARGSTLSDDGAGPPPFEWSADGCSFYPIFGAGFFQYESRFHEACLRHDFGYRNYGHDLSLGSNDATREWIDAILFQDAQAACGSNLECRGEAQVFYEGVTAFGAPAFFNG